MALPKRSTTRRRVVAILAAGATAASSAALLVPGTSSASSHREAPYTLSDPLADNTDTYAFVSPDNPDTVTLVANWIPFQDPAGGPNFYPWDNKARYEVHIDNNGDAKPDITYRWLFKDIDLRGTAERGATDGTFLYNDGPVTSFNDPDLKFKQTYTLQAITYNADGTEQAPNNILVDGKVAPSNVGRASMPDYGKLFNEAIMPTSAPATGGKSFAGQADDSFFLDLRVFDLLYGTDLSEVGDDTLAGFNVQTLALQINKRALAKGRDQDANPIIGVWSTTSRRDVNGNYRQVSRLGHPLVNEVVIPLGKKNKFNASYPKDDGQFLDYVVDPELARLLEAIYGINTPEPPRDDLVAVFLTGVEGLNQPPGVTPSEQLRLNMSIDPTANPERLGVLAGDNAGYPNGRRLTDDVIDIALQVVAGELVAPRFQNDLGDEVNRNERGFKGSFPYVALPHSGSNPAVHSEGSGATALSGGAPASTPGGPSGVPVVPMSVLGLGLLALASGAVAWTKRPKGAEVPA